MNYYNIPNIFLTESQINLQNALKRKEQEAYRRDLDRQREEKKELEYKNKNNNYYRRNNNFENDYLIRQNIEENKRDDNPLGDDNTIMENFNDDFDLNQRIIEYNASLESGKNMNNFLIKKINQLNDKVDQKIKELHQQKEINCVLYNQRMVSLKKMEEYQKKLNEINNEYKDMMNKNEYYSQQNNCIINQYYNLKGKYDVLVEENNKLKNDLYKERKRYDDLNNKIEEKNQLIELLKQDLKKEKEAKEELKSEKK